MTKTIVVLGAGLAGLPLTHYLLSHTATSHPDLRVVLVNPSDEFYWNIASIRAVLPGQLSEDKYLFSIPKVFAKYPASKFEFIAGKASALLPDRNSVEVALHDGSKRVVEYHTVVIATGSEARESMPWKNMDSSAQMRAAIAQLKEGIESARSIIIGGAGVTGVELAGELGHTYAKPGKKKVTIVAADALPLTPEIMDRTRSTARDMIEKLGVKVVTESKITSVEKKNGKTTLEVTKKDGSKSTLEADLFIPTYGVAINTQFAPADMLDQHGQLIQDAYLRSPKYKNVIILGDAGNLRPKQAVYAEEELRHFAKQVDSYLKTGKLEEYKFDADKVTVALSVGPGGGTGQVGTMKPFSMLIWFLKSRYLGTNYAAQFASGVRSMGGKW